MNRGFISLSVVTMLSVLLAAGALSVARSAYLSREHSWFVLAHRQVRELAERCTSLVLYRYAKGWSYQPEVPVAIHTSIETYCVVTVSESPLTLEIQAEASSTMSSITLHTSVSFDPQTRTVGTVLRAFEDE